MLIKKIVKKLLPPVFLDAFAALRRAGRPREWEYVPEGWRAAGRDPRIKEVERARHAGLEGDLRALFPD
jgi:hypothetical protein